MLHSIRYLKTVAGEMEDVGATINPIQYIIRSCRKAARHSSSNELQDDLNEFSAGLSADNCYASRTRFANSDTTTLSEHTDLSDTTNTETISEVKISLSSLRGPSRLQRVRRFLVVFVVFPKSSPSNVEYCQAEL